MLEWFSQGWVGIVGGGPMGALGGKWEVIKPEPVSSLAAELMSIAHNLCDSF